MIPPENAGAADKDPEMRFSVQKDLRGLSFDRSQATAVKLQQVRHLILGFLRASGHESGGGRGPADARGGGDKLQQIERDVFDRSAPLPAGEPDPLESTSLRA